MLLMVWYVCASALDANVVDVPKWAGRTLSALVMLFSGANSLFFGHAKPLWDLDHTLW